jgi:hypothetical protein
MGPNDASGVVWALGGFFFLFRVFLLLTVIFRLLLLFQRYGGA